MAEGSIAGGVLSYAVFALLALILPGVGLMRLLRLTVDPALVLPLGLASCAAAYEASRLFAAPALFPVLLGLLSLAILWTPGTTRLARGPSWRHALPGAFLVVTLLAATEYPLNTSKDGVFLLDPIVPEDAAFHAALAWELTMLGEPQVPGLAGSPLDYHQGLSLVRAAAQRYAGVDPYDSLSRFGVTLSAMALVLALGAAAPWLKIRPAAALALPLGLMVTDLGFLFAGRPNMDLWIRFSEGTSMIFWMLHANAAVPALAMALGALIALRRFEAGEGRGWLVAGGLLSLAIPHFKIFVAAQFVAGLGLAFLLRPLLRTAIACVGLPSLVGIISLLLAPGSGNIAVTLDGLEPVRDTAIRLGFGNPTGMAFAAWSVVWIVLSLGVRVLGIPLALRTVRDAGASGLALATMALVGWPLALIFRIQPLEEYNRQAAGFNEAQYFLLQSAPLLWLFTVAALDRLLRSRRAGATVLLVSGVAALAFAGAAQLVAFRRSRPPVEIPAAIVRATEVLVAAVPEGTVVLIDPRPRRYPPPPLVFSALRVTYTHSLPWLTQFAAREIVDERLADVRTFFDTTDPEEALAAAVRVGASYVALYGSERLHFDLEGILLPLIELPNVRIYRIVGLPDT